MSRLAPLSVHSHAVIAQPIIARAGQSLALWYIASWGARAVVVVYASCDWFTNLIERVKIGYSWHWVVLLYFMVPIPKV